MHVLPRGRANRVFGLRIELDSVRGRRERKKQREHGSNNVGRPHLLGCGREAKVEQQKKKEGRCGERKERKARKTHNVDCE
jgi:hypothetical protein